MLQTKRGIDFGERAKPTRLHISNPSLNALKVVMLVFQRSHRGSQDIILGMIRASLELPFHAAVHIRGEDVIHQRFSCPI